MLDQEDGESVARPRSRRRRGHPLVSSSLRPEEGSSSSSTRGLGGQRPGQLDQPRRARSAAFRPCSRPRRRSRPVASNSSATWRRADTAQLIPRFALLGGHEDVLERRKAAERLQLLERAGDPHPGPLVRGVVLVMSTPSSLTLPALGSWRPVMTLNNVVLPGAVGPISPVTRPTSTSRLASDRARRPPKRTMTSSVDSNAIAHLPVGRAGGRRAATARRRRRGPGRAAPPCPG